MQIATNRKEVEYLIRTTGTVDKQITQLRDAITKNTVANQGLAMEKVRMLEHQNHQRKKWLQLNSGYIADLEAKTPKSTLRSSFITPDGPKHKGDRNTPFKSINQLKAERPVDIPIVVTPTIVVPKPSNSRANLPPQDMLRISDQLRLKANIEGAKRAEIVKKAVQAKDDHALVQKGQMSQVITRRRAEAQKRKAHAERMQAKIMAAKRAHMIRKALGARKAAEAQAQREAAEKIGVERNKNPASQQINRTPTVGPVQPLPSQPSTHGRKSAAYALYDKFTKSMKHNMAAVQTKYGRNELVRRELLSLVDSNQRELQKYMRGLIRGDIDTTKASMKMKAIRNETIREMHAIARRHPSQPVSTAQKIAQDNLISDRRVTPTTRPKKTDKNRVAEEVYQRFDAALNRVHGGAGFKPFYQQMLKISPAHAKEAIREINASLKRHDQQIQDGLTKYVNGTWNKEPQEMLKFAMDIAERMNDEVMAIMRRRTIPQAAPDRAMKVPRNINIPIGTQVQLTRQANMVSHAPVLTQQQQGRPLAGLFPALRSSMQGALRR